MGCHEPKSSSYAALQRAESGRSAVPVKAGTHAKYMLDLRFFSAMDSRLRGNDDLESVPHVFQPRGETASPSNTLFCLPFARRAGFNCRI